MKTKVRKLVVETDKTQDAVVPTANGEMIGEDRVFDAKTGKEIIGPYALLRITSDEEINLNGRGQGKLDMEFALSEKNIRKLIGTASFLKLRHEMKGN